MTTFISRVVHRYSTKYVKGLKKHAVHKGSFQLLSDPKNWPN